jgi:hypothetical protein
MNIVIIEYDEGAWLLVEPTNITLSIYYKDFGKKRQRKIKTPH